MACSLHSALAIYELFVSLTEMLLGGSSATLTSVGQWNQSEGCELDWISPTSRTDRFCSCVFPLGSSWVQHDCRSDGTLFQSLVWDSSKVVFPRRLATTAACNSRRGIVSSFRGTTLDLATRNQTPDFPSASLSLTVLSTCTEHKSRCITEDNQWRIAFCIGGCKTTLELDTVKHYYFFKQLHPFSFDFRWHFVIPTKAKLPYLLHCNFRLDEDSGTRSSRDKDSY